MGLASPCRPIAVASTRPYADTPTRAMMPGTMDTKHLAFQKPKAAAATDYRPPTLVRLWKESFGYLPLVPALAIILGLNLYPTAYGIFTSFTDQSLLDPNHYNLIGLANYFKLFADPTFQLSFLHSLELTGAAVALQVFFGLILAHLLIQRVPGIQIFRSLAMVTWVLPIIAAVVIFRFFTLPNYGFFNLVLTQIGLGQWTRNWFGDENFAFLVVLVMHLWRNIPFYAIAFMAAMQAIPQDLYEAARIDGATRWHRLIFITLPNLRYIILVMVVLHVTFTYASAGGVVMLVVLVILVMICRRVVGGYQTE
jgi:multiple sugar transport system permease protein